MSRLHPITLCLLAGVAVFMILSISAVLAGVRDFRAEFGTDSTTVLDEAEGLEAVLETVVGFGRTIGDTARYFALGVRGWLDAFHFVGIAFVLEYALRSWRELKSRPSILRRRRRAAEAST